MPCNAILRSLARDSAIICAIFAMLHNGFTSGVMLRESVVKLFKNQLRC